ncbi:MAG TPA: BON domain-containing protein [Caldilineae bacterium]|nr:BON domain-containing protein [Caldilineae bacterium]
MFKIGADVYCTDGRAGRLVKVVVDPHTRRVTDLIVEKGFLQKKDRVIPIEVVEKSDDQGVYLRISSQELKNYPEYKVEEFTVPAPDWESGLGYSSEDILHWYIRYGTVAPSVEVRPMIRQRVQKGIDPNETVIGRGTRVHDAEGTIGHIDHLLVNKETGEITHLVLRKGIFPRRLVIPIDMVKYIDEEGIYIHATREELEKLSQHTQRADKDILAELRERLAAATEFDLSHVKATLEDGLVRLSGQVADVAAKRHAEAIARSIEGVVGVENAITTDTGIVARVIAALEADPRTRLAVIDVASEHGVVTLSGKVSSPEVRKVAEEIARQQEGVVSVINALEVEPDQLDELTPPIRYWPIQQLRLQE